MLLKIKKATPGFEPGVRALQAPALPLGHVALTFIYILLNKEIMSRLSINGI